LISRWWKCFLSFFTCITKSDFFSSILKLEKYQESWPSFLLQFPFTSQLSTYNRFHLFFSSFTMFNLFTYMSDEVFLSHLQFNWKLFSLCFEMKIHLFMRARNWELKNIILYFYTYYVDAVISSLWWCWISERLLDLFAFWFFSYKNVKEKRVSKAITIELFLLLLKEGLRKKWMKILFFQLLQFFPRFIANTLILKENTNWFFKFLSPFL
jgi:hypothetical protein